MWKLKETQKEKGDKIVPLSVRSLRPCPNHPRKTFETQSLLRLAESIREFGMLEPITVRRITEEEQVLTDSPAVTLVCDPNEPPADYEIIAGERRYRAALILGLREVPCRVLDVTSARAAEISLTASIMKEDLNPLEQAAAIASLIDLYGLTEAQIARRLCTSEAFISDRLRLLRLTEAERRLVLEKGLTAAQAEALIARRNQPRPPRRAKKFIFRDLRAVYNTLDRVIGSISSAGVKIEKEQRDTEGFVEIVLRIPKEGREAGIVSRETVQTPENVSRGTQEDGEIVSRETAPTEVR